jgi:hypothetical protein
MHPEKTAQTTPVCSTSGETNACRYAHAPLMLAHDRRVLDVPLEERLQSRTSELLAWAKTMLPLSTEASATLVQLQTGHQDIRSSLLQQRWSPRVTQQQHHQYRAPLVPKQQHHQYRAPLAPKRNTTSTEPAFPTCPSWIGGAFRAHEPG